MTDDNQNPNSQNLTPAQPVAPRRKLPANPRMAQPMRPPAAAAPEPPVPVAKAPPPAPAEQMALDDEACPTCHGGPLRLAEAEESDQGGGENGP